MEYRILGPLELLDQGRAAAVAEGRERTLLLLLLLQRPRPVSVDTIVDALWPEAPPASAGKVVQNYVLRLRKTLGHDAVATVSGGYALRVDDSAIDATRASALLAAGRAAVGRGDTREAEHMFSEALVLWRGEPLADVRHASFAQAEIARLDELRLSTIEERNDAQLRLGEHLSLVPDLEQQVREQPLRERLAGQLMLALYRSGRQADALAAYQAARTALDERGLEPSRDLRELERSVLNQDPDLDSTVTRDDPMRGRSRRRAAVVGIAIAALAAAVVAGGWLHGRRSERPVSTLGADSVAELDAHSGLVQRSFAVGKTPTNVVVTRSAAWITSFDDRTVTRVDLHSGGEKVVGSPSTPTGIAVGSDGVWVISTFDGTVERLDGSGAGVLAVLRLRPGLKDVAADQHGVWVTNGVLGTVTKIDPRTNEVIMAVRGFADPVGVAIGANRIWVAEAGTHRVDALSLTGRIVLRLQLELEPGEIAFGNGALWVTNPRDSTVTRIDPYSHRTQIVSVGARPSHVAVGGVHVWVTLDRDHSLVELDGRTGALQRRLTLASPEQLNRGHTITPGGLSASSNSAWISIQGY